MSFENFDRSQLDQVKPVQIYRIFNKIMDLIFRAAFKSKVFDKFKFLEITAMFSVIFSFSLHDFLKFYCKFYVFIFLLTFKKNIMITFLNMF